MVEPTRAAGFGDVVVRVVAGERRVASITDQIAMQKRWPLVMDLFASLDEEAQNRAWAEVENRLRVFERPDGTAVFPSEILVFGATR